MFAPDQTQVATELFRVTRPGGRIGMANWTPDSFIGALFRTLGQYIPPAPGLNSPALWGTAEHSHELFPHATAIEITEQTYHMCYASGQHWVDMWRRVYGPLQKAFAALNEEEARQLQADLIDLIDRFNVAGDGTMQVPSSYLQVIVHK